MYQCGDEITRFHKEKVTLSEKQRGEMRERRKANRSRLKSGLVKNGDPKALGQRTQGSYAMRTMIQEADNKYDIDDGVYFARDSLVGLGGGHKAAIDARNMVRDALDDGSFKERPPKTKKNCVRVYYKAGYHVDVPVYRTWTETNFLGEEITRVELAGPNWKASDPSEVTTWFKRAMSDQSPSDDKHQFRRITRYIKKFSHSRDSWQRSNPSGFTLSKLVEEKYVPCSGNDEESLHETMKAIKARLDWDLSVKHPVVAEMLATSDDPKTKAFRTRLSDNLKHLNVLESSDCSKKDALLAWSKVFNDDFFSNLAADVDEHAQAAAGSGLAAINIGILTDESASAAVHKRGGGRFGGTF